MSKDRAAQIEQRLAKATPGPWAAPMGTSGVHIEIAGEGIWCRFVEDRTGECEVAIVPHEQPEGDADAEFIAASPTDIAWLLGERARLREALTEIAKERGSFCEWCGRAEKPHHSRCPIVVASAALGATDGD
ncbi:MAG: hypothetical protein KGL39_29940 [Patescibacteria group bacterium]|nr:hypothetical protein [Patescibacteria group bacterium]